MEADANVKRYTLGYEDGRDGMPENRFLIMMSAYRRGYSDGRLGLDPKPVLDDEPQD